MKEVSLSGSVRANVGKKDAKAVRVGGNVPCVIYGGEKQTHFSVSHVDMEKLVYTPNVYLINVDVDGKTTRAIIQDIQFHPVTDKIWHVDFIELDPKKKVKMNIPVHLEGRAIGVLNGGRLQQIFRTVKVFALPDNMPDSITVDITKLRIGHSIRIKDLATDTLEILNAPNAVVCSIKMARGAVDEGDDEEGAEGEAGAEAATEEAEA
ncbi:50S ribosomal protein L25/general stress protein Ctc [Crocinitomix catalasitica]|uniref:50S ribosomal protein L25/general stress protein Ctc n=1 Tax=Crocinitomix catalasitica TaxID=184607 RepID=UPI000482498B|nr:50S ribosomal protein L25/general stress protein Ctc [Crocinitomix catalasitica]